MKILFIAMAENIHTARWLSQINDLGWDIHVFASRSMNNVHPELRNVTVHHPIFAGCPDADSSVRHRGWRIPTPIYPKEVAFNLQRFIDKKWPNFHTDQLRRLIPKLKPDIIHVLEFQHGGYKLLEAKKQLEEKFEFPPIILSSWGIDIHLYRRIKAHQDRLKDLLSLADLYISDCARDIPLARELGYTNEARTIIAGGGYHMGHLESLKPPSQRKLILIKGYQHITGRALFALRALALCKDLLMDYELVMYFASEDMKIAAELFFAETGIPISIFEVASHEEWLHLLGRARVNIGVSISDGTPLVMLESLLVGTFPIQSCTACANEWFTDGETGLIVPPENPQAIAEAVQRALTDDELVDHAAEVNRREVRERADFLAIQPQVIQLYKDIAQTI